MRWLIDTGSPYATLSSDLVERLQAKPADLMVKERVDGVDHPARTVHVPALCFGPLIIAEQIAIADESSNLLRRYRVDGVLGTNSFRGAKVLFDFPRATFTCSSRVGALGPPAGTPEVARFRWQGNPFQPRIGLSLRWPYGRREDFEAALDTGSDEPLRLPDDFAKREDLGEVVGSSMSQSLYGFLHMELIKPEPEVSVPPFPIEGLLFRRQVAGPRLFPSELGHVGMSFLMEFAILLDFEGCEGLLWRP